MNTVSLCVPTYKRAAQLAVSLNRLIDAVQSSAHSEGFEVCVSDNASDDDTPAVIARAAARLPIRHARQAENWGYAGNFAAVLALATGDSFVILADDDELTPGALDLLTDGAQRLNAEMPLVLFNSLPGGDAVVRGMRGLDTPTVIAGPDELLRKLGVFHASFVSNLMFQRPAAVAAMKPEYLKSRYPHTILALELLKRAPATFIPGQLVNVHLPADAGDQPLLTCVDMARVQSEHALGDPRCRGLAGSVYRFLMQMIPTAVYLQRSGKCHGDAANPFARLSAGNLWDCYRQSWPARLMALTLYAVARSMPLGLLRRVLRRVSRHPR